MAATSKTREHARRAGIHQRASQSRVVIEHVQPEIDAGRFPIKRVVGDRVTVQADVFADGHDEIQCRLRHRSHSDSQWSQTTMTPLGNDRWTGEFELRSLGRHFYTIAGWVDAFGTWRRDLKKKVDAGQDVRVDLLIGADLVSAVAECAGPLTRRLHRLSSHLADQSADASQRIDAALDGELAEVMADCVDPAEEFVHHQELEILVDRPKARFSAWYEMFPRSAGDGRHGTFADVESRLEYVASMGFDVLYLPPIHPIGVTNRKGRNNRTKSEPGDVGSPWAIGSVEGGHKSIHPDLGSMHDFHRLVRRAREHGMEIALDIALQCSPDHPYVHEHPEWFRHRPDGTLQYAENPPKKYEDIYPFDFASEAWWSLWQELRSVFLFWIEQGVSIFRVDNPHTKPFAFWEWLIADVRERHPETIFLSEAFTRPNVMHRLAKLGFTQSYTYFAWKNTKRELETYFTELTQTEAIEYFRANAWPNTPDILNVYLQHGGRPAFVARLVLAATLAANYGIYGPAFELGENVPREPGSEEYLNSEKYELRVWDLQRPDSLRPLIERINQIRHGNPALQRDDGLRFHACDNESLICYSKATPDFTNVIVVAVNLDPRHTHHGWMELPLGRFGIDEHQPFVVHDLLTERRFTWQGCWNYIELNPHVLPAHVFELQFDQDRGAGA